MEKNFTTLETYDYFGSSVSLKGNYLAVGAPGDNATVSGTDYADSGAVYIFKRGNTGWGITPEKVYKKDSTFTSLKADDRFGEAVSLDGDRLAVGAPGDDAPSSQTDAGAAYIFKRTDTTWADTPEKVYEYNNPSTFIIFRQR